MNELVINEVIKMGAESAVEMFSKQGVTPTQKEVAEWVQNNWEALVEGMVKGVSEAAL